MLKAFLNYGLVAAVLGLGRGRGDDGLSVGRFTLALGFCRACRGRDRDGRSIFKIRRYVDGLHKQSGEQETKS